MLGRRIMKKATSLAITVSIWCVYSMVVLAAPTDANGELTITGTVTVNGQAAVSNSTIRSGSVIETGAGSMATASLGKAGKVELGENSSLTLRFTDNSITGILSSGKVRVMNSAGVATTFTTKDATVIADMGQANTFALEIECSHTHVDTFAGMVTMRTGTNDKQIAAGTDAVAGNLTQAGCKPCMRPVSNPAAFPVGGSWLWLLAAAGGAATAIFIGLNEDPNPVGGGGPVVVSPVRPPANNVG